MSLANCKTVCREIEEADHRERLTAPALEHVGGCRQCRRFYDERMKLRHLVASLERVTAPADFDLRLRSRIANERAGAGTGFWFSNFNFGVPSIALASLALVIGAIFATRVWNASPGNIAIQESPKANEPSLQSDKLSSGAPAVGPVVDEGVVAVTSNNGAGVVLQRNPKPKRVRPIRNSIASLKNGGRLATKEFSSTPAPVIKKEEAVASLESFPIFSIETSSQPLRLSLDYSGGASRTISVPALSFGSEGVLTGGSSTLVKNTLRGAW